MPLFGNKFSPKKGVPRKSPSLSNLNLDASERALEFGEDTGPIKLKLGQNEMVFENGLWISDGPGAGPSQKDIVRLKKQNQGLMEENYLLKVKIDVLLDMLLCCGMQRLSSSLDFQLHLQELRVHHRVEFDLRAMDPTLGLLTQQIAEGQLQQNEMDQMKKLTKR